MAHRSDDMAQAQRMNSFNSQAEIHKWNQQQQAKLRYKQELDQQIQGKKVLRAYGNMTNVEKEMNKDDLLAWKKYDNNQYSLIPGFSSKKAMPEVRAPKHGSPVQKTSMAALVNEEKLNNHERRLQ